MFQKARRVLEKKEGNPVLLLLVVEYHKFLQTKVLGKPQYKQIGSNSDCITSSLGQLSRELIG